LKLSQTSANVSLLGLSAGYTFMQSNDKTVNLMLVANQQFIVVAQPWTIGQVTPYTCLASLVRRLLVRTSNNVVFGNRCPLAKDAPNVIENGEVAVDFPPEANVADISSSSVALILDQNDTHYILQMTDTSIKSMEKTLFVSSFVLAQNATW
jgi:hypothetical protein